MWRVGIASDVFVNGVLAQRVAFEGSFEAVEGGIFFARGRLGAGAAGGAAALAERLAKGAFLFGLALLMASVGIVTAWSSV